MNTTTPAVYVGTYHKYNSGSLSGKWLNLTDFDDKAEFVAACHALHANEHDPELMFQDIEGIPSQFCSESSVNWDFIDAYKQAKDESNDAAFIAWAEHYGVCDYDTFRGAYLGEAESEEAFAIEYAEETGILSSIPETLQKYFDYDAFTRDLFCDGYLFLNGFVFTD